MRKDDNKLMVEIIEHNKELIEEYPFLKIKDNLDDMLTYTYELFSQRKDILSAWKRRYPYILVDEFQDINQIQ